MKRILILSLFLALLSACVTQRRCNYRFPPKNDTIRLESVRDSIIVKDTTIYIQLPGEIVRDSVPIPCPPPPPSYIPERVTAETSLAKASAWWSYPVIKLELIQKDTTIEKRLAGALQESHHWKTEYEKIRITPAPVKYIPGIYKISLWLWIGVIIGGIIFIVLKKK